MVVGKRVHRGKMPGGEFGGELSFFGPRGGRPYTQERGWWGEGGRGNPGRDNM